MNKIIPILSVCILSACSTEQTRTSKVLQVKPIKVALASQSTTSSNYQYRLGSRLKSLKTAIPDYFSKKMEHAKEMAGPIVSYLKQGSASWYGSDFHGKKTATGEIFDMYAMTAAHKTLPLSSYAKVTNLKNHLSVVVRINDRGPFHGNRVLDLSYAAAKKLDMTKAGTGNVEIKAITPSQALPELQQIAERQEKSIFLQVGAFDNQKKALKLKDKIAANHLPQPKILHSKHKKSTLYKVQIGPIKAAKGVDELNHKLATLGITSTQLVAEIE